MSRRPRFKGIVFPSWIDGDAPKPRREYNPHSSTRAQIRNLKAKCRHVLDSKDPELIAAGLRVMQLVQGEPNPEFSTLHLYSAAIDASNDTGESVARTLNYFVDTYEQRKKDSELSPPTERNEADASLSASR